MCVCVHVCVCMRTGCRYSRGCASNPYMRMYVCVCMCMCVCVCMRTGCRYSRGCATNAVFYALAARYGTFGISFRYYLYTYMYMYIYVQIDINMYLCSLRRTCSEIWAIWNEFKVLSIHTHVYMYICIYRYTYVLMQPSTHLQRDLGHLE